MMTTMGKRRPQPGKPLGRAAQAPPRRHLLTPSACRRHARGTRAAWHPLAALALAAASLPAAAVDVTWLGGNGNWRSANWSTGAYPATGLYRAVIDSGGVGAAFVTGDIDVTLAGLRIGATDTLAMSFGYRATLLGDVSVAGTLRLNRDAQLRLEAPVTFSGAGRTLLDDSEFNVISSSAGSVMTVAVEHTVTGGGSLGRSGSTLAGGLVNQGLIRATDSMRIDTGGAAFVNAGTVRSSRNLALNAATDNRQGLVQVDDGAVLQIGGSLGGGTLRGLGTSYISGGRVADVTLEGSLLVNPGDMLTVGGRITNNGTLALGAYTSGALTGLGRLHVSGGAAVLAGSGQTVLVAAYERGVVSSDAGSVLTIAAGHTVRGSGYLGASFAGGTLSGGLVNEGLIAAEAVNGIRVDTAGAAFDNTRGRVTVADGSVLQLADSVTLRGGTLAGSGSARLRGGTFRDVTLEGAFQIVPAGPTTLAGVITGTGTLSLNGNGFSGARVFVGSGGLTLAGSGRTVLDDNALNLITSSSGDTLTVAAGHTLRGGGRLGSAGAGYLSGGLVNQGRIVADAATGMGIDTGGASVLNRGTVRVEAGSLLIVNGTPLVQDSAGAVLDVRGRLLAPLGVQARAGVVQGAGRIEGNVDATGATLAPGNSAGVLTVTGAVTLGTGSHLAIEAVGLARGTGYDWLDVGGSALLGGVLDVAIGYGASIGDSYSFLTASAVSGRFDSVTSPGYVLSVSYGSTVVTATVTAITPVPEPATWALWLAGATALAGAAIRNQHKLRETAS